MKKLLALLGVAALLAMTTINVRAQADTNAPWATPADTNAPSSGILSGIWQGIATSDLLKATNYAIEPYATYAPSAPKGQQYGGGLFVAYNLNNYVSTGLGVDYLGQFSMVSANVQLKYALHPFASFGNGLTNVALIPFGLVGGGHPLSGASGSVIAITDVGGYVSFGHMFGGQFNLGAAYGRWDGAGVYSGNRYHLFTGWSKGF